MLVRRDDPVFPGVRLHLHQYSGDQYAGDPLRP
jgi:hypothetical protein